MHNGGMTSRLLCALAAAVLLSPAVRAQEDLVRAMKAAVAAAKSAPKPASPAETIAARFQQKRFPAPAPGACGLKSFTVQDYEIRSVDGEFDRSAMTEMGAVTETTGPECARDYAVVQFIRGCVYHARYSLETGALLERTFDHARRLRGQRVVFNHPGFEVDNYGTDPLYASDPGEADRLAYLYVPKTPLKLRGDRRSQLSDLKVFDDPAQRVFLADADRPTAVIFITDLPDNGMAMADESKTRLTTLNPSLDFRTCLYRVKDIPVTGDPAGPDASPDQGGPLACFSWKSRYTFDPVKMDFVTDAFSGVDPFCAQAPARAPLPGS